MKRQLQTIVSVIAISGAGLLMGAGSAWAATAPSSASTSHPLVLAQNDTGQAVSKEQAAEMKKEIEQLKQGLEEQKKGMEEMRRGLEMQQRGTEKVEKGLMHQLEEEQCGWKCK